MVGMVLRQSVVIVKELLPELSPGAILLLITKSYGYWE